MHPTSIWSHLFSQSSHLANAPPPPPPIIIVIYKWKRHAFNRKLNFHLENRQSTICYSPEWKIVNSLFIQAEAMKKSKIILNEQMVHFVMKPINRKKLSPVFPALKMKQPHRLCASSTVLLQFFFFLPFNFQSTYIVLLLALLNILRVLWCARMRAFPEQTNKIVSISILDAHEHVKDR